MNKSFLTVAQVFAILGSIFWIFYGFLFFVLFNYGLSFQSTASIVGVLFFTAGAFNIVAAVRLNAAKENSNLKGEALGWSIYLIFTTYFIGGVFGILGATLQGANGSSSQPGSIEQQLKELENLFDKGLISKEEYQVRRMKIIERV